MWSGTREGRPQEIGVRAGAYAVCFTVILAACGGARSDHGYTRSAPLAAALVGESPIARSVLSAIKARSETLLPPGLAESFESLTDGLRPRFGSAKATARLRLPTLSAAAVQLEDDAGNARVEIGLDDALMVEALAADGYIVYPHAHVSGATLLERGLPDGVEDYLSFESAPATPSVSFRLALRKGVSGLRLVAGELELLDATGTPKFRVEPPYIVGADGARTDASLTVEG